MTLLDFELHICAEKVAGGRTIFLNDPVIELFTNGEVWKARIGVYEVLVGVKELRVFESNCQWYDFRTHDCEHVVAVLFAIRNKLDLKPILASTVPKIKCIDNRLENMMEFFHIPDYEVTDEDSYKFMLKTRKMLERIKNAFEKTQYLKVASLCFAIIAAYQKLDDLLEYTYPQLEACVQEAFNWLEKLYTLPVDEELLADLFHDTRIEAVKNYHAVTHKGKNWMDLLLAGANNATRKEKFTRTMNALCILVKASEDKEDQRTYVEQFLYYRDKLQYTV